MELLLWIVLVIFTLLVATFVGILLYVSISLPPHKKFIFEGKHAFISGGSRGIGKQIAISLLRRGCRVTIAARDAKRLQSTRDELVKLAEKWGRMPEVNCYTIDVTDSYDKIENVMRKVEEKCGPVNILINNAGNSVQDIFDNLPITQFEQQIKLNYLSAVYLTRTVIKQMKEAQNGHIGFVCSAAGQCPIYGYTAYGASKFAMRGFAESLHMELLPYNIGVSILYPPNTNTEGFLAELSSMPKALMEISDSAGLFEPSEVAEAYVNDIALGNFSTTVGLEGGMLGLLTASAAPEPNFLRAIYQILLAGLLRGVVLCYIGHFNKIVAKHTKI